MEETAGPIRRNSQCPCRLFQCPHLDHVFERFGAVSIGDPYEYDDIILRRLRTSDLIHDSSLARDLQPIGSEILGIRHSRAKLGLVQWSPHYSKSVKLHRVLQLESPRMASS